MTGVSAPRLVLLLGLVVVASFPQCQRVAAQNSTTTPWSGGRMTFEAEAPVDDVALCLLQAIDYGEGDFLSVANGTYIRGYDGLDGVFAGRLATVIMDDVSGQYIIDDDASQLTSDMGGYKTMKDAVFGNDNTIFVIDQHTVEATLPGLSAVSVATLTRVNVSGAEPVVMSQVDLCGGEPVTCFGRAAGDEVSFSIDLLPDRLRVRKAYSGGYDAPGGGLDAVVAPRNEFWNYDFDLTLAANTTQNYTAGCDGEYDSFTGFFWRWSALEGIFVCEAGTAGTEYQVVAGDTSGELIIRAVAVDPTRAELVVVVVEHDTTFVFRFDLEDEIFTPVVTVIKAPAAVAVYRLRGVDGSLGGLGEDESLIEDTTGETFGPMVAAGGSYWVSRAGGSLWTPEAGGSPNSVFGVYKIDPESAEEGDDGVLKVDFEMVADTIDRGVSERGVATRAFHVYVGVAGTDFDGCDQYSVGWAGGSLLSTRAATNLFIICCCVAVCCCICCFCRYTYLDDYDCEDLLDFICCCSKECCGDCLECTLGGCAACLGACWGACRACCGRVCRRRPRPAAAAAAAADDPAAAEAGRGRSASLDSVGTTTTTTTAATGSSGSLSGGYSSEVAALRAQLAEKDATIARLKAKGRGTAI